MLPNRFRQTIIFALKASRWRWRIWTNAWRRWSGEGWSWKGTWEPAGTVRQFPQPFRRRPAAPLLTVRFLFQTRSRRRRKCWWSGLPSTTSATCWCAETWSWAICEHLSPVVVVLRRAWRRAVLPGQCSRSWRRDRPMWSTSSGGSSLNKVGSYFGFPFFCF